MRLKSYKAAFLIPLIFFCILMFNRDIHAAPAKGSLIQLSQPTGETFEATLQGDEWFSWQTTKEGEVIHKDKNGFWCYGESISGEMKASSKKVAIDPKPAKIMHKEDVLKLRKKDESKRLKLGKVPAKVKSLAAENMTHKILVLLVEFNDVSIANSDTKWSDMFFKYSSNSVNDYYKEVSNGRFGFSPAEESSNIANDGVVKVNLNYNHPNTATRTGTNNRKIVMDALTAAQNYVDYSSFDSNNDGYISDDELKIVTVVAGYEYSSGSVSGPSVWAHYWAFTTPFVLDGKMLCYYEKAGYVQYGEIEVNHMAQIGTPCHELGHALGLPDLYDTDYSSEGAGIHTLMASGCATGMPQGYIGSKPAHLDPWSKIRLGFIEPQVVTDPGRYAVNSIGSNVHNVLKVSVPGTNEYFLIENREFEGYDAGLDTYCKKGGIAIWHIDEGVINARYDDNAVNDDETHKGVDIEESNEAIFGYPQFDRVVQTYYYKGFDHYFYQTGNNTFSPVSVPDSKAYRGMNTDLTVKVMGDSAPEMRVNIYWGANPIITGDVNGDNLVDVRDALSVMKYDAGLETFTDFQVNVADVDGNGTVDMRDVLQILKIDAELT